MLPVELHFLRQRYLIVDAVIFERPRDDIPLAPFAHGPAYVLSRDAGYRGKVALADLMA